MAEEEQKRIIHLGGPQDPNVEITVTLPEGLRVEVTLEIEPLDGAAEFPVKSRLRRKVTFQRASEGLPRLRERRSLLSSRMLIGFFARLRARLRARLAAWPFGLGTTLFVLSLLIYLLTRLIGLEKFPIYFFTDEAIQTLSAVDLLRDNFKSPDGQFLPTYFQNGNYYNLGVSVYLQVLPYLLFGKSVFVTRAVSVLVTLLAAVSVGLLLRDFFAIPYWWGGVLLLSTAPAWFLHSRTAFETVEFVSLYAATLYVYLLYRCRSPRYLYLGLVLAGLAFYTYSPGQLVIGATGLLLFLFDLPYHWKNRITVLKGIALLAVLAVPYIRFRLTHPFNPEEHLSLLGSYLVQPIPLKDKLLSFWRTYSYGLSPGYWFIPNDHDLARHLMKGYGHLLRVTLPFAFLGMLQVIRRIRQPASRVVLFAFLSAPAGAALVEIGITRTLVFVIPAVMLTALGVSAVLEWFERWLQRGLEKWRAGEAVAIRKKVIPVFSLALFAILAFANVAMLRDALINGSTWFKDFGLGGMQYGGAQLSAEVQQFLKENPSTRLWVSPSWANGADVIIRFFLGDPLPVHLGSIDGNITHFQPLSEEDVFVVIPEEMSRLQESGKFRNVRIERTVNYPNGAAGFYFIRLQYVPDAEAIFAVEKEARRQLQEATVTIDNEAVQARYSRLDMGSIGSLFDGDPRSVARTFESNPMVVELEFGTPRLLNGISLVTGSSAVQATVQLLPSDASPLIVYEQKYTGSVEEPGFTINFSEPVTAAWIRLEILEVNQSEPANIHLWEVTLLR